MQPKYDSESTHHLQVIAHIQTDFVDKFGIPRQSGLVPNVKGKIVFTPEFRIAEAVRGLEGYSHIWLIWGFSKSPKNEWTPTVRPPRLGGNERVGVFASRSPFRPNGLGLSSVQLDSIDWTDPEKPVLWVSGVDMLNQTPLYDIKPYSPHNDCHPEATGGFSSAVQSHRLSVSFEEGIEEKLTTKEKESLIQLLALDPRPGYQKDGARTYAMDFSNLNIRFSVNGDQLKVIHINKTDDE